jgi:hypothetical protein
MNTQIKIETGFTPPSVLRKNLNSAYRPRISGEEYDRLRKPHFEEARRAIDAYSKLFLNRGEVLLAAAMPCFDPDVQDLLINLIEAEWSALHGRTLEAESALDNMSKAVSRLIDQHYKNTGGAA